VCSSLRIIGFNVSCIRAKVQDEEEEEIKLHTGAIKRISTSPISRKKFLITDVHVCQNVLLTVGGCGCFLCIRVSYAYIFIVEITEDKVSSS